MMNIGGSDIRYKGQCPPLLYFRDLSSQADQDSQKVLVKGLVCVT